MVMKQIGHLNLIVLRFMTLLSTSVLLYFRLQKQMIHSIQLQNRKEGFGSI